MIEENSEETKELFIGTDGLFCSILELISRPYHGTIA